MMPITVNAMLALSLSGLLLIQSNSLFAQSGTKAISINKKTANRFVDRNRDAVLEYQCRSIDLSNCSVVCSSGGNNYIKADNVRQAFYAERKSNVNGSTTGYHLVVDVAGENEDQDIWATLQIESSCLFKGLAPTL